MNLNTRQKSGRSRVGSGHVLRVKRLGTETGTDNIITECISTNVLYI
jgi:hypothetical protein